MKQNIACTLLLVLTMFVVDAAAQKDKLALLATDTPVAEAQAWISKNLSKNFGYATVDDTVKISDLKLEGCTMSYRVLQRYTDQKSDQGDRPALGRTGATTAVDLAYSVHEDVWIDLKQIDPARVSLGPLPTPKGVHGIGLETVGKKDLIKFDRKGTRVRYDLKGVRNSVLLPVKENAGEALAKGLQYVISVCRAKPVR